MKKSTLVKLSGFCEATFNCGWGGEDQVEGFIVQLDGKNYGCYRDPDDGYRSYGSFFETDKPCTRTFEPQSVIYVNINDEGGDDWYEDPKYKGILLKNSKDEIILEVSTTWYDSYYPIGHCSWNPQNLPINQIK